MGRAQQAKVIDEGGLYEVVLLSRKPEARDFKRWLVIGGKKLPPQLLVTGGWAAAIFCTIAFFGVFWGVTA